MTPQALAPPTFGGRLSRLWRTPRSRIRWIFGSAALGGSAVLGLVLAGRPEAPWIGKTRRAEIIQAVGACRLIQARLSGEFLFAPWKSGIRCDVDRQALRRVEQELHKALERQPVPAVLADAGLLQLIGGKYDAAIDLLERANAEAPEDGRLASDRAAAYLARAQRAAEPYDFFLALEAAERAVALAPSEEALFNLALAREQLFLSQGAQSAWKDYLRHEETVEWRSEASSHLGALAADGAAGSPPSWKVALATAMHGDRAPLRALAKRFSQQVREHAEGDLLRAWVEGNPEKDGAAAEQALSTLHVVVAELSALQRDPMMAETVTAIDRAKAEGGPAFSLIVAGHLEYAGALDLYAREAYSQALPGFLHARDLLVKAGSPFAGWASFWSAFCAYQIHDYAQVRSVLEDLVSTPENSRYLALLGRAKWILGLVSAVQGDATAARAAYSAALGDFEAIGEHGNIAKQLSLLANLDRTQGADASLWMHLYRSLAEGRLAGSPVALFVPLEQSAAASLKADLPRVALAFQEEMVAMARADGRLSPLCEALKGRARALRTLGRSREALADLEEALQVGRGLLDTESRRSVEEEVLLVRAEVERATDPASAEGDIDRSLETARATENRYLMVPLLLERARAHRALQRPDLAERDLLEAAAEGERQRDTIPTEELQHRLGFSDALQTVYRDLALVAASRRDGAKSLDYVERGRAQVLRGLLAELPDAPGSRFAGQLFSARDLATLLPADLHVVEYLLLDDRLLAWTVSQGGVSLNSVACDRKRLTAQIHDLLATIENGRDREFSQVAQDLYEILIGPVEEQALSAGGTIVFAPDGPLFEVPYAALVNPQTQRFLVEDHATATSLSLALLAGGLARTAAGEKAARLPIPALVVEAPTTDPRVNPNLGALSDIGVETAALSALRGARVLRAERATRAAVLSLLPQSSIFHFGGHSIANLKDPMLSRFLLAPAAEGDPGVLLARDLLKLPPLKTRLVTLASCSTAVGPVSRSEGAMSLAWPFLAAGVPEVIAALWRVPDEATAQFFASFYSRITSGAPTVSALQEAQLAFLRSGSPALRAPRAWAGFAQFGSLQILTVDH
ncbi:MAG TPA: CHAT domain-containing protein [Thermoanaerobaculia bacterium]|nr:CHAT domain-containing protein [Thermoanaerobaculia bacterium]